MFGITNKRNTTKTIGQHAEEAAKDFLSQQGLIFITNNYACRRGEIDLIMQDKDQLVFVEVKYRSNENYGSGTDVVHPRKQRKIILAARHYLHKYQLTETSSCRFDIVSIKPKNSQTSKPNSQIQWLKNAFDSE